MNEYGRTNYYSGGMLKTLHHKKQCWVLLWWLLRLIFLILKFNPGLNKNGGGKTLLFNSLSSTYIKHMYDPMTNLIFQIFDNYLNITGLLCNLVQFILSLFKRGQRSERPLPVCGYRVPGAHRGRDCLDWRGWRCSCSWGVPTQPEEPPVVPEQLPN